MKSDFLIKLYSFFFFILFSLSLFSQFLTMIRYNKIWKFFFFLINNPVMDTWRPLSFLTINTWITDYSRLLIALFSTKKPYEKKSWENRRDTKNLLWWFSRGNRSGSCNEVQTAIAISRYYSSFIIGHSVSPPSSCCLNFCMHPLDK